MRYSHQTAAERAHSAVAWAALVSGATSPDPLPEESCFSCGEHECRCPVLITCPACEGRGEVGRFAGHGYALEPETCGTCEGRGEVDPREVW
jgi:DnaJ-class molecular chaperone